MSSAPFSRIAQATPQAMMARLRELELLDEVAPGRPYWLTDAAYLIDARGAEALLEAANTVHRRCRDAVGELVASGDYERFGIGAEGMKAAIERSWQAGDTALYGRMDFSFDREGVPRLLDYEADSPFGLSEASYVQWEWFEAVGGRPGDSQENLIYEKLMALLPRLRLRTPLLVTHGGGEAVAGGWERFDAEYLAELLGEVGLKPQLAPIAAVGWDEEALCYLDAQDRPIAEMMKVYPWDWMEEEPNAGTLAQGSTRILPAAWTRLLGDKTLMALLWHMFPGERNLLPSFLERPAEMATVAKPCRGWDGEHVFLPGQEILAVPETEVGPLMFQAACPLPAFATGSRQVHAAVSVWMVDGEAAGLSFRESDGPVTGADARFAPHILRG